MTGYKIWIHNLLANVNNLVVTIWIHNLPANVNNLVVTWELLPIIIRLTEKIISLHLFTSLWQCCLSPHVPVFPNIYSTTLLLSPSFSKYQHTIYSELKFWGFRVFNSFPPFQIHLVLAMYYTKSKNVCFAPEVSQG